LAAVKAPKEVEGHSLLPIIHGRATTVRPWLLAAFKDFQRMIRDDRWKLIAYRAGGTRSTQLFDLQNDPDELHNLADDPKYADERRRLEKLLMEARREFGDPVDFDAAGR
jgi:arylsulfatase A-like enzyme